jgi:hypothetical protein
MKPSVYDASQDQRDQDGIAEDADAWGTNKGALLYTPRVEVRAAFPAHTDTPCLALSSARPRARSLPVTSVWWSLRGF